MSVLASDGPRQRKSWYQGHLDPGTTESCQSRFLFTFYFKPGQCKNQSIKISNTNMSIFFSITRVKLRCLSKGFMLYFFFPAFLYPQEKSSKMSVWSSTWVTAWQRLYVYVCESSAASSGGSKIWSLCLNENETLWQLSSSARKLLSYVSENLQQ